MNTSIFKQLTFSVTFLIAASSLSLAETSPNSPELELIRASRSALTTALSEKDKDYTRLKLGAYELFHTRESLLKKVQDFELEHRALEREHKTLISQIASLKTIRKMMLLAEEISPATDLLPLIDRLLSSRNANNILVNRMIEELLDGEKDAKKKEDLRIAFDTIFDLVAVRSSEPDANNPSSQLSKSNGITTFLLIARQIIGDEKKISSAIIQTLDGTLNEEQGRLDKVRADQDAISKANLEDLAKFKELTLQIAAAEKSIGNAKAFIENLKTSIADLNSKELNLQKQTRIAPAK